MRLVPLRRVRAGRRPFRLAAIAGLLGMLALVASSCGVGSDATPQVIKRRNVPFGLLDRSPPTTSTGLASQYVTIYLDSNAHLVAVSRAVPAPASLSGALAALGGGPTNAEAAQGLESPISTAVPLTLSRKGRHGPIVTVSVSGSFTSLAGADQAIAMAQLVFTVTAFPGVTGVDVRVHGHAAKVPTAKGTLAGGPLVRADYASLAPV